MANSTGNEPPEHPHADLAAELAQLTVWGTGLSWEGFRPAAFEPVMERLRP